MTDDRKDSKWLERQLVTLLERGMAQEPVDAAACAKIADLLWKMLPRAADSNPQVTELEAIRQQFMEQIVESAAGSDG